MACQAQKRTLLTRCRAASTHARMMTAADLRAWRARHDWTQTQAAKAIGYSRRGIQIAEKTDCSLTPKMELAIIGYEARAIEAKEGEGDE